MKRIAMLVAGSALMKTGKLNHDSSCQARMGIVDGGNILAELNEAHEIPEPVLIQALLDLGCSIVHRNPQGTLELRGEDFIIKLSDQWLTIYHGGERNLESRSHLHLKRGLYRCAEIVELEEYAPTIGFWVQEDSSEGSSVGQEPSLAFYFPPFYRWNRGEKTPVPENQRRYREWVAEHGRRFRLTYE